MDFLDQWWHERFFIRWWEQKEIFYNPSCSCLWLFFCFHFLWVLKICSCNKTPKHLWSNPRREISTSDIFFIKTFLPIFLLNITKGSKSIRSISKRKVLLSPIKSSCFDHNLKEIVGDKGLLNWILRQEEMLHLHPPLVGRW